MKASSKLKAALRAGPMVVAPGCFDVLSAKLIESAGFPAAHYGSGAASAMQIGVPDVGFLTLVETVDQVRRITGAVDIPVIADGEAGYGNAVHVRRTVRELEAASAAAITLEDVAFGKHVVESPPVVAAEELVDKIKAAADARRDPDLQLIGRTDCLARDGLSAALDRVQMYAEAGADLVWIVGLKPEDAPSVARQLPVPLADTVPAAKPDASFDEMAEAGITLALFWNVPYLVIVRAMREALATLMRDRSAAALLSRMAKPEEIDELMGVREIREAALRHRLVEQAI